MRLAIADPPYLGKSEMWYGERSTAPLNVGGTIGVGLNGRRNPNRGAAFKADQHPDAAAWDDPARHRALVAELVAEFDGWAIALLPDNLFDYLAWVPRNTRIAVWHDPKTMPTGAHPRRRWEAVLISRCPGRRRVVDVPVAAGDVLTCQHPDNGFGNGVPGFAGRKPRQWVEWVLDMLGYCQTHDTVTDLFPGSGAVTSSLAQGRLTICRCEAA